MEREKWINLRGLAVIAVVMIHATTGKYSSDINGALNLFVNQLSRFAVPVFFVSSGFGLFVTNKQSLPLKKYYLERFKILVPLYIISSFVYFILTASNKSLMALASALLNGNARGHLYYLPVLMFFYLIYPFVYKFLSQKIGLIISFLITIVTQLMVQFSFVPELSNAVNPINWIFYFALGVYLASNLDKMDQLLSKRIVIFLMGFITIISSSYYSYIFTNRPSELYSSAMRPSVMLYTIGILLVFLVNFDKPVKLLSELDKNSLIIYLFHPLVLIAVRKGYRIIGIQNTNFMLSIILCLLGVIISYVFSKLIYCFISSKNKTIR